MTDTESGEERKQRHRLLAREITDPLAAVLLSDISSGLKADPLEKRAEDGGRRDQKMARTVPRSVKRRSA